MEKLEREGIELSEKIGQFEMVAETKTGDQIVSSKNAKVLQSKKKKELE